MTLEDLITQCKKLRADAEHAEERFLLFLMRAEDGYRETWQPRYSTFETLLKQEALADPARYTRFKEARRVLGDAAADAVGVNVAIAATGAPEDKRSRIIEAANAWIEEHGGVKPSQETASDLVRAIAPRERTPMVLKRKKRYEDLEEENTELRRQIAELKRENVVKEKEIAALQKKLKAKPQKAA